jgi:hypothetical protein
LRKRLEEIRKLTALRKGENVSTSEIAKQLLESAREDRLEVVDLLANATESLVKIRRKGEADQMLSRAEWTVVGTHVGKNEAVAIDYFAHSDVNRPREHRRFVDKAMEFSVLATRIDGRRQRIEQALVEVPARKGPV